MTGQTEMDKAFIIVKYGDNEEAIFNPWCSSLTLMEWIRRKCNCGDDVIIDLVDLEGQVKNLAGRSKDYANEIVTGRETYILIKAEKLNENGQYHYTSLLNNLEDGYPDLMVKLNSMSRPTTRSKGNRLKGKNTPKPSKAKQENTGNGKRPPSSERKKTTK